MACDIVEPCQQMRESTRSDRSIFPSLSQKWRQRLSSVRRLELRTSSQSSMSELWGERSQWSPMRKRVAKVLANERFDTMMAVVISINLGLMIVETNQNVSEACEAGDTQCSGYVVVILDYALIFMYTVEVLARIFVWRLRVLLDCWALVDVVVVVQGLMGIVLGQFGESLPDSLALLKLIRVFRILRAVRIIRRIPELYTMVRGFFSAMSAMAWGFAMIVLMLVMWSILAVEYIHDINRAIDHGGNQWCYDAFSSVQMSSLFFFQTLVAGDSWGECTIPIIRESYSTAFIFAGASVTVQLGFTNLILSVIVDTASQEREKDRQAEIEAKRKKEQKDTNAFLQCLRTIDTDGSGNISVEELQAGYERDHRVRNLLAHFNMEKEHLFTLFSLMDMDESGEVSYHEFIDYLIQAETQDLRVQIMNLKLELKSVGKKLHQQAKKVDHVVKAVVNPDLPFTESGAIAAMRPSLRSTFGVRQPRLTPMVSSNSLTLPEHKVESLFADPFEHEGPSASLESSVLQQLDMCQQKCRQLETQFAEHDRYITSWLPDGTATALHNVPVLPKFRCDGANGSETLSIWHRESSSAIVQPTARSEDSAQTEALMHCCRPYRDLRWQGSNGT